jgi:hypothetical protein
VVKEGIALRGTKKGSKLWPWTALVCLSTLVVGLLGWDIGQAQAFQDQSAPSSIPASNSLLSTMNTETVDVVGGSMAHGWKDPNDNSYIKRAFSQLTSSTNTTYKYVDRTTVGGTASWLQQSKPGTFEKWMKADKPQIVVISWGLMNDVSKHTKEKSFKQAIHQEIAQALQAHAVVLMVSPPVVQASATYDKFPVNQLIAAEFEVAASFHSKNVYTFNLNQQMTNYLAAHNQTYKMYKGDSWHPNQAGHELAGQLLYNDMMQTLGQAPIIWKTAKSQ